MARHANRKKLSENQKLTLAVVLSLLAHLLIFLLISLPWHRFIPIALLAESSQQMPAPAREKRIEFELVDTPDDAVPLTEPKSTPFVSDKSAAARDEAADKQLPIGDAYADGIMDVAEYQTGNAERTIKTPPTAQAANQEQQTAADKTDAPDDVNPDPALSRNYQPAKLTQKQQAFLKQMQKTPDQRPLRKDARFRDQQKTKASNFGGFTLDTYEWEFAPYLQRLKEKIDANIFPPAAFSRLGIIEGTQIIQFKIYRDGHVADIQVLKYDGHTSLRETSLNAIIGAKPFGPLPLDFPRQKKFLTVTAKFIYFVQRTR